MAIFDLPVVTTCPGAAKCINFCYAMKQEWWGKGRPTLRNRMENFLETFKTSFPDDMVALIKAKKIRTFRPHESGDYHEDDYVKKWIEVAERCPDVRFFCYTKSIDPKLFPSMRNLASLPNFTVIFSYGGKYDHLIDKSKDNYARVVRDISRKTIERGEYVCPAVRTSGLVFEKFCAYNCSYCVDKRRPNHQVKVVFHESRGGWTGIRLAPRPRIVRPPRAASLRPQVK